MKMLTRLTVLSSSFAALAACSASPSSHAQHVASGSCARSQDSAQMVFASPPDVQPRVTEIAAASARDALTKLKEIAGGDLDAHEWRIGFEYYRFADGIPATHGMAVVFMDGARVGALEGESLGAGFYTAPSDAPGGVHALANEWGKDRDLGSIGLTTAVLAAYAGGRFGTNWVCLNVIERVSLALGYPQGQAIARAFDGHFDATSVGPLNLGALGLVEVWGYYGKEQVEWGTFGSDPLWGDANAIRSAFEVVCRYLGTDCTASLDGYATTDFTHPLPSPDYVCCSSAGDDYDLEARACVSR